jgi:hypothetical protein
LFTYNWKAYEYFLFAYTVCFLCKLFTMRCFLFHLRFCRETHSTLLYQHWSFVEKMLYKAMRQPRLLPTTFCHIQCVAAPIRATCAERQQQPYTVAYGLAGTSAFCRIQWAAALHGWPMRKVRKGSGVGLRVSTGQKLNFSG